MVAIRPIKYLISYEYRRELKSKWSDSPRVLFYIYVFYGLVLFVLLISYIVYHFYLKEPDPTKIEQLKRVFIEFQKIEKQ